MAANMENGGRRNRWRLAVWGGAAGLLLLPLIAMQFENSGVDWTGGDFIAMGIMLAAACGLYEVATRMSSNPCYRAGAAVAVLIGFFTVWSNLAVGIIGSENDALNLMFFGVVALAIFGSLLVRFRARGLVKVTTAAAVAQLVATAVGLTSVGWENGVIFSTLFAAPWLLAAELFRRADEQMAAKPVI